MLTLDPGVARGATCGSSSRRRTARCRCGPSATSCARRRRTAARPSAVVVFTPAHAPTGIAPFTVLGDDVYCVIDPEAPEPAILEAAIRLARLLALASLDEHEVEVDAAAIARALRASASSSMRSRGSRPS